jgi:hypothetical protein
MYNGPRAMISRLGIRYGGYGGGAMVRYCDDNVPPPQVAEYLVLDYYIAVEGQSDFYRAEMCAHGYPHKDFVCNPDGSFGLYSGRQLVSQGDTVRVRFIAWLFPPGEPVCSYTTEPPNVRLDSVRIWLKCECEPDAE